MPLTIKLPVCIPGEDIFKREVGQLGVSGQQTGNQTPREAVQERGQLPVLVEKRPWRQCSKVRYSLSQVMDQGKILFRSIPLAFKILKNNF